MIRRLPIFVFIRLLEGVQPCSFPRPASCSFYVPYSCCSCNRELNLSGHHYLDWIRRSLILCQRHIELSSSKNNMSQNEQDLTSEPPSTSLHTALTLPCMCEIESPGDILQ